MNASRLRGSIARILQAHSFRYLVFGIIGVTLDYGLFSALLVFQMHVALASGLGYVFGTVATFSLNLKLNFRLVDMLVSRASRFFLVALVSATLSSVLISMLVPVMAVSDTLLKLLVTTPFLVAQFIVNKRWTFREVG